MLLKCCTQYASKFGKTQQGPQNWKRSVFIPGPKKGQSQRMFKYCTIMLISHVYKVMLKILQARLQQYVNRELSDVQAGFRKGRGTGDQIANICWIIEKARKILLLLHWFSSVQSLSCVQLFATPWMAAHQSSLSITLSIMELAQTYVHRVGDAIQWPHPLSSPSPPALNLSHHLGLFKWVSSSHQVAKVLEFHLQHQSYQWTPRTDLLEDGLVGSPCSPRDSQESPPTP